MNKIATDLGEHSKEPSGRVHVYTNQQQRSREHLDFDREVQHTSCPNSHRNLIDSSLPSNQVQQSITATAAATSEAKKHPLVLPDIKKSKSNNENSAGGGVADGAPIASRLQQSDSVANDEVSCKVTQKSKSYGANNTSEVKFDLSNMSQGHVALNKDQSQERLQINTECNQVPNLKLRSSQMPQIQTNHLHVKYNIVNQHNFKLETCVADSTTANKGQFIGSMIKMSPQSQKNQKLQMVQKINFRSNTKDQPGKSHMYQKITQPTQHEQAAQQTDSITTLQKNVDNQQKKQQLDSSRPSCFDSVLMSSRNKAHGSLQQGTRPDQMQAQSKSLNEGHENNIHNYQNGFKKQSPESDAIRRSKNQYMKDLGDVR